MGNAPVRSKLKIEALTDPGPATRIAETLAYTSLAPFWEFLNRVPNSNVLGDFVLSKILDRVWDCPVDIYVNNRDYYEAVGLAGKLEAEGKCVVQRLHSAEVGEWYSIFYVNLPFSVFAFLRDVEAVLFFKLQNAPLVRMFILKPNISMLRLVGDFIASVSRVFYSGNSVYALGKNTREDIAYASFRVPKTAMKSNVSSTFVGFMKTLQSAILRYHNWGIEFRALKFSLYFEELVGDTLSQDVFMEVPKMWNDTARDYEFMPIFIAKEGTENTTIFDLRDVRKPEFFSILRESAHGLGSSNPLEITIPAPDPFCESALRLDVTIPANLLPTSSASGACFDLLMFSDENLVEYFREPGNIAIAVNRKYYCYNRGHILRKLFLPRNDIIMHNLNNVSESISDYRSFLYLRSGLVSALISCIRSRCADRAARQRFLEEVRGIPRNGMPLIPNVELEGMLNREVSELVDRGTIEPYFSLVVKLLEKGEDVYSSPKLVELLKILERKMVEIDAWFDRDGIVLSYPRAPDTFLFYSCVLNPGGTYSADPNDAYIKMDYDSGKYYLPLVDMNILLESVAQTFIAVPYENRQLSRIISHSNAQNIIGNSRLDHVSAEHCTNPELRTVFRLVPYYAEPVEIDIGSAQQDMDLDIPESRIDRREEEIRSREYRRRDVEPWEEPLSPGSRMIREREPREEEEEYPP